MIQLVQDLAEIAYFDCNLNCKQGIVIMSSIKRIKFSEKFGIRNLEYISHKPNQFLKLVLNKVNLLINLIKFQSLTCFNTLLIPIFCFKIELFYHLKSYIFILGYTIQGDAAWKIVLHRNQNCDRHFLKMFHLY